MKVTQHRSTDRHVYAGRNMCKILQYVICVKDDKTSILY